MPDHTFLSSSSRETRSLLWVGLFVIAMHAGLFAIGKYWNPASPKPKEKTKVIVQTISLHPMQSKTIQNPQNALAAPAPPPSSPMVNPSKEIAVKEPPPIPQPVKEEASPPEEAAPPKEETPLKQQIPAVKEEPIIKEEPPQAPPAPPPSTPAPAPVKKESKPQPKAPPKPVVKETTKTPPKKTAPVKKPEAKSTPNPVKKQAQDKTEADKKLQAEKEKKKQEQAAAEKKRQEEKAEAEKKHQKELAEQKKRDEELAAAQAAARKKEQALLSKAKENLAKMGETRDKISSSSSSVSLETTTLPKALGTLQVDALPISDNGSESGEWGTKEVNYSDEVAYRLKMALKLPDYGDVKIKLTLDRSGKVIKVETIKSESSKNKAYVESKITNLLFPPFGQRFQGVPQNTFVITLQNDS